MSSVVVGIVQCECEITYLARGSKCRLDNEIHKNRFGTWRWRRRVYHTGARSSFLANTEKRSEAKRSAEKH